MKNSTTVKYPALRPLVADWMSDLFDQPEIIRQMIEQYGSPVNVLHLAPFAANYHKYRRILEEHQLQHQIFFARKANKCRHFVREAGRLGFGVDTASYRELKECLELGIPPDKLVLTAAIKNEQLLQLAATHKVLVIVDNEDECELLKKIAAQLGQTIDVGLRVSGFYPGGEKLYSRFGVDIEEAEDFMLRHFGPNQANHRLRYQGLHFHLNGYSPQERSMAILSLLDLAKQVRASGLTTRFIDIGGGLLMNYLENDSEWKAFHAALADAVANERDALTFGNNGLGLQLHEGEVIGSAQVYPYFNRLPQDKFLEKVLQYTDEDGRTVAEELRLSKIELRMEPGRSLLDQCGMTIARVVYRKYDSRGDLLIGLEMNRTQLFSSSADFLLDPSLLYQQAPDHHDREVSAYFVGASCLEQDVILKRKIRLEKVPDIGDLVCFPNTAGYLMHFYETETHLFELAKNLILEYQQDGGLSFREDEDLL